MSEINKKKKQTFNGKEGLNIKPLVQARAKPSKDKSKKDIKKK